MKLALWSVYVALTLFALAGPAQAMEGYIVCGTCKYFDPSTRSCKDAPGCEGGVEGSGYDCGHCGTWYADSERGHCETIVGCCGATSLRWPQVLWGENQAKVADDNTVIYNPRRPGSGKKGPSNDPRCYAYNRDGVTCHAVGYQEGQSGAPWGQHVGQFLCTSGCLKFLHR